jgi:hypothetical protein
VILVDVLLRTTTALVLVKELWHLVARAINLPLPPLPRLARDNHATWGNNDLFVVCPFSAELCPEFFASKWEAICCGRLLLTHLKLFFAFNYINKFR